MTIRRHVQEGVLFAPCALAFPCSSVLAAPVSGELFDSRQPDGTAVQVRVCGDEFYQHVDEDGSNTYQEMTMFGVRSAVVLLLSTITFVASPAVRGADAVPVPAASDKASRPWFPLRPMRDGFQATVLDCSQWVEAPTGKHGFVAVKGERFLFEDGTPARFWGALIVLKGGLALGFILLGLTILAKLVIAVWLKGPERWMDKALPLISMAAICLIIAVITAQSRDQLLTVGPLLILAAILHNGTGYGLGYWGARLARLDEAACRAVAMEVGMQNGGMASGIAIDVLKSTSAALAPAIFGPWMNISGSLLAGWWRRRPAAKSVPVEDKR